MWVPKQVRDEVRLWKNPSALQASGENKTEGPCGGKGIENRCLPAGRTMSGEMISFKTTSVSAALALPLN
jgi:hypothetical protein